MSAQLAAAWADGGEPALPVRPPTVWPLRVVAAIYSARTAVAVALIAASLAAASGSPSADRRHFGAGRSAHLGLIDVWMAFQPVLLSIVLAA